MWWRHTAQSCGPRCPDTRFHPNPKLTEAQTQAVIKGYKLDSDGCLRIETNKALAFYVQRKMLIIDLKLGMERWCLFDVR
jgi:hypothetical protein